MLAFILSLTYLVWRGLFTLPWKESAFALTYGIVLWLCEVISNLTAFILIGNKGKLNMVAKPEIALHEYPNVDVLIATHNEEVPLLLKTVNAAVNMNYPDREKVHIYISDDKNRPEVKALAAKFNVGYIGMKNNRHAKSGNLNNALSQTNAPLVATFDADMIPYSDFLLETVPYFVGNQKARTNNGDVKPLGLVQTPQSFYNADLFQFNFFAEKSLPNEQDFFSRKVNILNNAHGSAIYTGSNTLILRKAIEDAGGFPIHTITEDFEMGARINCEGYSSFSTSEPKASGLAPTDIPSILKQRIRWARGVVQSVRNLRLLRNKKLAFQQKLVYLNGYLYWWSFIRRLIFIIAPILFTVFNIKVVDTNLWTAFLLWLPAYSMLQLAMHDVSSDIRTQRWAEVQETIFAPYLFMPVLLEAIGIKQTKFKVTNKAAKQAKSDLLYGIPHMALMVLAVIGLVKFNFGKFGSEIFSGSVITFWLLVHLYNLLFSVIFFLGRPVHRIAERFLANFPIKVQYGAAVYDLTTDNISETGLSFSACRPLFFPQGATLRFELSRDKYVTHLEGSIIRVISGKNRWTYGVVLNDIPEKEYLQYLLIIYDGFNQSLPQFRDLWLTTANIVVENLSKRQSGKERKTDEPGIYPVVYVRQPIQYAGCNAVLLSFNYVTMTIEGRPIILPINDVLNINDVQFELEFCAAEHNGVCIYNVVNYSNLINTPELDDLVAKWQAKQGENDDIYSLAH